MYSNTFVSFQKRDKKKNTFLIWPLVLPIKLGNIGPTRRFFRQQFQPVFFLPGEKKTISSTSNSYLLIGFRQSQGRCGAEVLSTFEYARFVQIGFMADDHCTALIRVGDYFPVVIPDQSTNHLGNGEFSSFLGGLQRSAFVQQQIERGINRGTVFCDGHLVELATVLNSNCSTFYFFDLKLKEKFIRISVTQNARRDAL